MVYYGFNLGYMVRWGGIFHLEQMPTVTTTTGDNRPMVLGIDRAAYNQGQNAKFNFSIYDNLQPTLTAKGPGAVATDNRSIMQSRLQTSKQSNGIAEQIDNKEKWGGAEPIVRICGKAAHAA